MGTEQYRIEDKVLDAMRSPFCINSMFISLSKMCQGDVTDVNIISHYYI
jgi:hypothetical protein